MVVKSDAQIHQEVLRELHWDSRVDETEVGVEVDQGVVTLTGREARHDRSAPCCHLPSALKALPPPAALRAYR